MRARARSLLFLAPLLLFLVPATSSAGPNANAYRVTKLVSDIQGMASHHDKNLVNAWGLSAGPSTPWWVADNGTNRSTLYDGRATRSRSWCAWAVHRPAPYSTAAPASWSVNGGSSGPSLFLFDTEAGTIRGWNPGVPGPGTSTRAFTVVNRHGQGRDLQGPRDRVDDRGRMLYATDFHNARVDVFDGPSTGAAGRVHGPDAPGALRAVRDPGHRRAHLRDLREAGRRGRGRAGGAGLGFVDMYSTDGTLLGRVASRGALDAPWGLALAPDDFGRFSGDLLVGNFGDGRINAYAWDGMAFHHDGLLRKPSGDPVWIDGLWAIGFGNGGAAGPTNSLYFTAGPQDESHGLFGEIHAAA